MPCLTQFHAAYDDGSLAGVSGVGSESSIHFKLDEHFGAGRHVLDAFEIARADEGVGGEEVSGSARGESEGQFEIRWHGDFQIESLRAGGNGQGEAALRPSPGSVFQGVPAIHELSDVGGGEGARAQQAEGSLIALRVPQDGVLDADDVPVADFPS